MNMKRLCALAISGILVANSAFATNNGATPLTTGYVYNPSKNALPIFRKAINRVQNNLGNGRIVWVGSSTVEGCNDKKNGVWAQQNSLEYLMAVDLTNIYGIPANNDGYFGAGGGCKTGAIRGSGWTNDTLYSIGGPMFVNTTTTNNLSFTLPTTADTVVIYYPTDNSGTPTLGTFTYQINSGSTTTINEGASAPGIGSATISITPGANTLNIARVSGTVKFIGMEPYLSTQSTIDVINSGVSGAVAATFDPAGTKPYQVPLAWNAFSPDATFIQLDGNDAVANTNDTTYKAQIATIITNSTNGDVLLIGQEPYGASAGNVNNLAAKVIDLQQLAVTYSLADIQQTLRVTSYDTVLTPDGFSNNDGLHANIAGYLDEADYLTNQIMAIANVAPLDLQRFAYNDVWALASNNFTGTNTFQTAIFKNTSGGAPLSVSGSTSGTISLIPQATAGTWNWEWPTTAGAAGAPLLSAGGSAAMTWGAVSPLASASTKFTASGCAISSTTGGPAAGTFTLGTNSCTAVITINGATGAVASNGWSCDAHDKTVPTVLIGGESSSTTTTASITIPAGAGTTDVISFACAPY